MEHSAIGQVRVLGFSKTFSFANPGSATNTSPHRRPIRAALCGFGSQRDGLAIDTDARAVSSGTLGRIEQRIRRADDLRC